MDAELKFQHPGKKPFNAIKINDGPPGKHFQPSNELSAALMKNWFYFTA